LWLHPESYETLSDALLPAGFMINQDGLLTPFVMKNWEEYVLAQRENRPTPRIRADVLHNLQSKYDEKTLDTWLFPPVSDWKHSLDGMWNSETRKFVSFYERIAREHGIKIPPKIVEKYRITDDTLEQTIQSGAVALLGPTTIDIEPSGPLNKLPRDMIDCPDDIPRFSVAYRGAKRQYDHPIMPSAYREFKERSESRTYQRLLRFAINLVIECVADEFKMMLTHNEAESIIQHYKIVPWTRMIDLTLDINIAKAIASNQAGPNTYPYLYQIVIWNLGYFDNGSQLIDKLPFRRPQVQSAIAHFGLALDVSTGNVIDINSLIISAIEYPLKKDGSGWERFGGPSFSIKDSDFPGPFLNDSEYAKKEALLYPPEKDNRARECLGRIAKTLKMNIGAFPELGDRRKDVLKGIQSVQHKLNLRKVKD
jgi:hypothetical protein